MHELTESELERLALLAEESAEVIQIVNKIIRHGYLSYNPCAEGYPVNLRLLEKELGHLKLAIDTMIVSGDISAVNISKALHEKRKTINQWLHYNNIS